jgi:hypothetical protein
MSTETKTALETWAIVELFGHNTIAGYLTEQTIGGGAFIRIDVPPVDDQPGFTKFYGDKAIYGITPTTEEVVRVAVQRLRVRPVSPFVVPLPPSNPRLVDTYAVQMDDRSDDDDKAEGDAENKYPF